MVTSLPVMIYEDLNDVCVMTFSTLKTSGFTLLEDIASKDITEEVILEARGSQCTIAVLL